MGNIIEDLGGILEPENHKHPNPNIINVGRIDPAKEYNIYLQFDNDEPVILFQGLKNGQAFNLFINQLAATGIEFSDTSTLKKLKIFGKPNS